MEEMKGDFPSYGRHRQTFSRLDSRSAMATDLVNVGEVAEESVGREKYGEKEIQQTVRSLET